MINKNFLFPAIAITSVVMFSCIKKEKKENYTQSTPVIAEKGYQTDAAQNYHNYCAGCHGEKMDMFVDRQWKHGRELKDLVFGIKNGYKDEGMPAFAETFSDKETEELAQYILDGIKNVDRYNFDDKPKTNLFESDNFTIKLDTVATGIAVPWGIAFLSGGELLVTDRGGKMYRVKDRKNTEVNGVPDVVAEGQGGLLDVVTDVDYENNSIIYFSYSKGKKVNGKTLATTAVMRAKLNGNKLTDQKIIFEANPYAPTRHHYGSRLVLDKGYLYISVGERGNENQNPQSLDDNQLGKIHRIYPDGRIPANNPFKDDKGKPTTVYCYGNRNPQSLAINPSTGELWETEHGPRGGDEINIIKPGDNYGWPKVSYGINYNGKVITDKTTGPGFTDPIHYWIPSIAPSGMTFVTSDHYKGWKGNLLVGSLRFQYLNLCYLEGNKVVKEEMLLKNIGRLRDVRQGPDGFIYVAVEDAKGSVFRLRKFTP
ncbi:PQQ-dependent sugar dehydrogenase [Flavobacterium beibuense]|uniref:Glucose sorbosone dehydrogenase n=1 Tax=Flavobacterium beibuense TaxID=657326 RepID=A0A444W9R1_9FLAO|nr:PQQ-dependent sugar dehydrogenase [Flavobacterium beibuense]RYJ42492.1 Glucose sorbosone dehydrogenase [Flavobacterium beibuense]